jgi:hypothetical protein
MVSAHGEVAREIDHGLFFAVEILFLPEEKCRYDFNHILPHSGSIVLTLQHPTCKRLVDPSNILQRFQRVCRKNEHHPNKQGIHL